MTKLSQAIEEAGFGITGEIGGLPRQVYYTPDGRMIKAISCMREYVIKDATGKITGGGARDANLDKGWLLTKPATPKLYCRYCDKWHDTQGEIDACGIRQDNFIKSLAKKTAQENHNEVEELKKQVAEMQEKLSRLTGVNNGQVVQPKST